MNQADFRKNYNETLKTFLDTPCGQNFLQVIGGMRPGYEYAPQPHLLAENRGAMRGYELCIRNIVGLAMPEIIRHDPEPTYGVPNHSKSV